MLGLIYPEDKQKQKIYYAFSGIDEHGCVSGFSTSNEFAFDPEQCLVLDASTVQNQRDSIVFENANFQPNYPATVVPLLDLCLQISHAAITIINISKAFVTTQISKALDGAGEVYS